MVLYQGRTAEIRWGHRLAAQLVHWSVRAGKADDETPFERRLTATIVEINAFAIHQAPLVLVIPRTVPIRWPILSLQIGSTHVHGLLGEVERPTNVEVRAPGN